jgi:hypothetical protein
MREGPTNEVLAGTPRVRPRITSWLGGRILAPTVPIIAGRATGSIEDDVLHKVSLTIARFAAPTPGTDVFDWRPGADPEHPLARFGQELDVSVITESVVTVQTWETRIGRYVITDWDDDDDGTISLKGEGVLRRVQESKLTAPTSPTGTFMSEARRLAPNGVGVRFGAGLVDRPCPTGMSWSDDRLDAWKELAAAWPALLRTDEWGQVTFEAPLPSVPVPVVTYTDGKGGTLISAPRKDSRKDAFNMVIASSSGSETADIQGSAAVTSGPMSVNGPYGAVVKKWSSPLIENKAQADASARTILVESIRPAQAIPAHIAPDPRLELDDPVGLIRGGEKAWGWVTSYDLPLTAADGDMRIDVGLPV